MIFIILQMTGHVFLKSYVALLEAQITESRANEKRAYAIAEESHALTKQVLERQKAMEDKMITNHQQIYEQLAVLKSLLHD